MGRHQDNPFRQYFSYDKLSNKSVCNIEGCGAEIAGNHRGIFNVNIQQSILFQPALKDQHLQQMDRQLWTQS